MRRAVGFGVRGAVAVGLGLSRGGCGGFGFRFGFWCMIRLAVDGSVRVVKLDVIEGGEHQGELLLAITLVRQG